MSDESKFNFSEEEQKLSKDKAVEEKKEAVKTTEKPFVLSAWNDGGYMMCINEYCTHYKLPRNDIYSYKLVSHTVTPFYNIQFKQTMHFSVLFLFLK